MNETNRIEYNEIEYTSFDDGRRHQFRTRTRKSFDQFKKDLEVELKATWASFITNWDWRGHTCHITSPGAVGSATLDGDIVTTELNIESWPATWLRDKIILDVRRMIQGASESSTLQKEEKDRRDRLRADTLKWLGLCGTRVNESGRALRLWQGFDDLVRLLVTVFGASSAFSLWAQGSSTQSWRTLVVPLVAITAVLSTIQSAFKATDKIKEWSDLQGHFVRLRIDLETLREQMDSLRDFPIADFQQRLEACAKRFGDGEVRWKSDLLTMWGSVRQAAAGAAVRGPEMRGQRSHRRLVSTEAYPWESAQKDLAEPRRLIEKHRDRRRKEELEDAEAAAKNW